MNQKNKGAAVEKPLFVDQECLEMCTSSFLSFKLSTNPEYMVRIISKNIAEIAPK